MMSPSPLNMRHALLMQWSDCWKTPEMHPALNEDEVHVWATCLDGQRLLLPRIHGLLSQEEQERAEGFRFAQHRDRFLTARGCLRLLLGRYLNLEPSEIGFSRGPCGKPHLAFSADLKFSVSRSGNLALFAFARQREVGVDAERVRCVPDREQLAERFFSVEEYGSLVDLPFHQRDVAFLNCWTRKEAYVKALGAGLSYPLDRFVVSLDPGKTARLIRVEEASGDARRWSLRDIELSPEYCGALVAEGDGWDMKCWIWPVQAGSPRAHPSHFLASLL